MGRDFSIRPTAVDESTKPGERPHSHALRLAVAKARAAATSSDPSALHIGADTIVIHAGQVLGKPCGDAEAIEFLTRLRGRVHEVATAVAVLDPVGAVLLTGIERTLVWMRDYGDDEVAAYVDSGDPLDKAGGYAIQHMVFRPVSAIRGSYTNVVGMPLGLTARLLRALEVDAD